MTSRKQGMRSLALLAATTVVVAACSNGDRYTPPPPPPAPPANTAPGISAITDMAVDQDTAVTVGFTVQDAETAAGSLVVAATVDGTTVFPADGVVLSGDGASRTLTLTPLEARTGTAMIEIRVTDAQGLVATRRFQVAINARNASVRALTFDTFAKGDADEATIVNGRTIQQDIADDDLTAFASLIPAEPE